MPLAMRDKVFITAALTGSGSTQDRSDKVPRSPEQIATAAPALAASIAAMAICSGLRGTLSLRSCVLPEPVNAAVMKTLSRMASGMVCPLMCRDEYGLCNGY